MDITVNTIIEPALIPLALLRRARLDTLTALLAQQGITFQPAQLIQQPQVVQEEDAWIMGPDEATALLSELETRDPVAYRQWHERVLAYLADELRRGQAATEPLFLTIFEHLATYLVPHDPKILEALITSLADVPLTSPDGQQSLRYFTGLTQFKLERYPEALAIFDALLAMPELAIQVRGKTLNARSVYYTVLGRWEAAKEGYHTSLGLWQQLGDRLNEGKVWLNLGIMAYQLQQYDEAESNLIQAERCFQATNSIQSLASVQNELGLVYRDQGRWADALRYFMASAEQARANDAHEALAIEYLNIGEVLLFQGQLAEAETSLQTALAIMPTRVFVIDIYLNLGLVRQVKGDLGAAQTAYEAALVTAQAIGRRDILAEVYFRLGDTLRRQGQDAAALVQFEAAAQVIESTREPMRDEGLKISLLGRWQQIYETLVLHCLHIHQPAAAWQWAERARARAFAEQVQEQNSQVVTHAPVSPEAVQQLLSADAALLNYFTTGVFDNHMPFLRALAANNPLREHLLTPACTLLFILTKAELTIHPCAIDPNAFASTSRRHEDRSRFLAPRVLAQLSSLLLPPVLPLAQMLYIIPHGPLHYIPFAALSNAAGEKFVHSGGPMLMYAPSATIWLQQRMEADQLPSKMLLTPTSPIPLSEPQIAASMAQPRCLAIGYDGAGEGQILRHTESEAQLIAEVSGGVAWIGGATKKARLTEAVTHCRWLHFACHGWFDYETPLASYLQIGQNERLTAAEILQTWRLEAELVTLSACQSGVHRVLRGDEPMGLIRCLLIAGAQTVLASQWPVEDLPTFLLMQHFYQQLVKDKDRAVASALQAAQIWLRELTIDQLQTLTATNPFPYLADPFAQVDEQCPFAHPRFWAGFVLFGG